MSARHTNGTCRLALALVALAACNGRSTAPTGAHVALGAGPPGTSAAAGPPGTSAVALRPPTNGAERALTDPRFALGAPVEYIAQSADGTRLAGCARGRLLRVWSLPDGREVQRFTVPMQRCTALTWLPGDQRLAVAGVYNFTASRSPIVIFDVASAKEVARTEIEGRDGVGALHVVDDKTLAVAASDGASLWSFERAVQMLTKVDWKGVDGHSSVQGATLAFVDDEDRLVVQRVNGPVACKIAVGTSYPDRLAISRDEKHVAIATGTEVRRYQLPGCTSEGTWKGIVRQLAFGPDGTPYAIVPAADYNGWELRRWPFDAAAVARWTSSGESDLPPALPVGFTADLGHMIVPTSTGAMLLAPGAPLPPPVHREEIVEAAVWNDGTVVTRSEDATMVWYLNGTRTQIASRGIGALDAAGTHLARVPHGKDFLEVVDVATAKITRTHQLRKSPHGLDWAGDSVRIARGKYDDVVDVGPTQTLTRGDLGMAVWTATSADGNRALVRVDEQIHVVEAQRRLATLLSREHVSRAVLGTTHIAIIEDTEPPLHASSDEPTHWKAYVYAPPRFDEVALDTERSENATAIAMRPDERLVLGYLDGTIRLLDDKLSLQTKLASGAGQVLALDVSPDGKRLVSAHADGHIYVWKL